MGPCNKHSSLDGENIQYIKVYCDAAESRLASNVTHCMQMYHKKLRPSFRGLAILKACASFKKEDDISGLKF